MIYPGGGKTKTVIINAGHRSRASRADDNGPKLHYLVYTGCHTLAAEDNGPRQACVSGQTGSLINTDACRTQDPDTQTQDIFTSPTGKPGTFALAQHRCVNNNAGDPIPLTDITRPAQQLLNHLPIPQPDLGVQPPDGKTLVNIRTLLFTHGQDTITKAKNIKGIRIILTATPVTWQWSADNQEVATTTWPGREYDGTDPKYADDGYYITHTFNHHGKHTLAVATTWHGTATFTDGTPLPIQRTATTTSPPQPITALQARTQLESGQDNQGPP